VKTVQEGWESYKEAVLDPSRAILPFLPIETILRLAFFAGSSWILNIVMNDTPDPTQEDVDRLTEELEKS